MDLTEIKLEIAPETANAIEELLLERGETAWSVWEDTIVRRAWLVGIFPSAEDARGSWAELKAALPIASSGDAEIKELAERDWRDSYKAHFKAWKFGRLHWVPIWEREQFTLPAGDAVIWLDPGLAFGTGNHETTRLCVERLVKLAEDWCARGRNLADAAVVDAGCGSGILALSAAKLGFGRVEGFDNDPAATEVSGENAGLNQLKNCVRFFAGDLISGLQNRQADIVLANIQSDVLIRFAPELIKAVAPDGALVLSGILAHEIDEVKAAFVSLAPGWTLESRALGEWADLLLLHP